MSRQRRVLYPGALYHVHTRGNERKPIFRKREDREDLLAGLATCVERYGWLCHAYCLMDNHFHVVVETPRPNLPDGMRHLNGCYAQSFNRGWNRSGHLFQGRYKAHLVEKEPYLLEVIRYVLLNPVRADFCALPQDWPWSSARAMLGLAPRPPWLTVDWALGQFGSTTAAARRQLAAFLGDIEAGSKPLPVRGELFLGTDAFVRSFGVDMPIDDVPREQWQPLVPPLEEIFRQSSDPLLEACERWGYTLREIGLHMNRHPSTVSRRLRRARAAGQQDSL